MSPPFLHIYLLGEFRLVYGDTLIASVNSPRLQSLLVYLLLHRQAPHPRSQLAFLFWPDSTEAQARTNLRNLLYRLRLVLPDAGRFLKEEGQMLHWQLDSPFTLDVAAFEAALVGVEQAKQVGDLTEVRRALEQAIQLYTGDLLPSCYDDWILPHRERLHQSFLEALEQLILLLESQRHYRQAISYAQRFLRHDPLHETTYRRLMRLHALSGDRASALRVYNTCITVLELELGVDPSPPTRTLYERILETDAHVDANLASAKNDITPMVGNQPHPLTSFIGREEEMDEVIGHLSTTRLLTLMGPPGSGKTRLAQEVAAQMVGREAHPEGVWWVELGAVTEPSLLPQTVAAVLGVRERPGEALTQTLVEHLHGRTLLLMLDNCEHVVEASSSFARALLQACPHLQILVTSREALGLRGELTWTVPPLSFPGPAEWEAQQLGQADATGSAQRLVAQDFITRLTRYESVRLFVERAAAALPTFRLTRANAVAVARLCSRLEGVPLAIELAAVRTKMIAIEEIAARLDDALRLLRANREAGLPRHQSLRAAIDWSYALLSEKEQILFRRLAVFSSSFTLVAAEQVAPEKVDATSGHLTGTLEASEVLDLLSQLIDKSLVVLVERELANEMRYRLLETVRQYAWEKLCDAGEVALVSRQHAYFFLALAEEADLHMRSSEEAEWLNRLDIENDNLRSALKWASERTDEAEVGVRLSSILWQFWDVRGYLSEGRRWLQMFIARASRGTAAHARALKAAGALAWSQADYASARSLMSESLELQRESGDQRQIAVALFNLGLVTYSQGDPGGARILLEESLAIFRALDHKLGIANALNSLGVVASQQGDYVGARPLLEESLAIRREIGDWRGIAIALGNQGVAAWRQGDYTAARTLLQESLERYRELGEKRGMATSLNELAAVVRAQNEDALARSFHQESLMIWRELGNKEGIAASLEGLAGVACGWGASELAARLLGAAEALRGATGATLEPAERNDVERTWTRIGAQLNEDQVTAARVEGRALTLEAAIELAARVQPQAAGPETDGGA